LNNLEPTRIELGATIPHSLDHVEELGVFEEASLLSLALLPFNPSGFLRLSSSMSGPHVFPGARNVGMSGTIIAADTVCKILVRWRNALNDVNPL